MLRPFFLHHRELLGGLCRAGWEVVRELIATAAGDAEVRPRMIAVSRWPGRSPGTETRKSVRLGGANERAVQLVIETTGPFASVPDSSRLNINCRIAKTRFDGMSRSST